MYALEIETMERRLGAELPGLIVAKSLGADVQIPVWHERRAEYDKWLRSEPPKAPTPEESDLLTALGLTER